jgi:UDP-2-acetamido-2-deoxy-ribo-hexuluronate aminotransferase
MDMTGMQARFQAHREAILRRFAAVVDHGRFISGPEVTELETALATWLSRPPASPKNRGSILSDSSSAKPIHVVTCASGTDALRLSLMALDVGPGDAVVLPAFGFAAAAEAIVLAGAQPVFADIDPLTFNLDPGDVERRLRAFPKDGCRPKTIIAIDTFGLPADYRALRQVADAFNLHLIEDAAQSMGAEAHGHRAGTLADIAVTSFYPTKTLGCMGDGGAVFTANAEWAHRLRRLRDHGQSAKYWHTEIGWNSRLDSMQAAVLLEMLPHLDDEIQCRQEMARQYLTFMRQECEDLGMQVEPPSTSSSWSLFTLRCQERQALESHLDKSGIPHACHYPHILPELPAFAPHGLGHPSDLAEAFPEAYSLCRECLTLPFHTGLTAVETTDVLACLQRFASPTLSQAVPG